MIRFLLPIIICIGTFAVSAAAQESRTDGQVFWRGEVDGTVQLFISGLTLEENTVSGRPQPTGGYSFTSRMPARPVTVSVTKPEGRGKVAVIQQPLEANGYVAIIEINDEKGGVGDYLIRVSWQ